ncbi:hypothetical protein TNCV_2920841 [Trichonephila clavipes]|nr:hypothetical protein TNCV_2920841 [Trichonephila clavipes]
MSKDASGNGKAYDHQENRKGRFSGSPHRILASQSTADSGMCHYHRRFQEKARTCMKPCKFSENEGCVCKSRPGHQMWSEANPHTLSQYTTKSDKHS